MAIAFDAGGSGAILGGTSFTVSHTCSGSNRALVVTATCANSTDYLAGATITYAGVSMGSPRVSQVSGMSNLYMYTWVLANPASGANNIVLTPTGGTYTDVVWASFTGVDQTTPVTATATQGGGYQNTSRSDAITVTSGGVAVDALSIRTPSATLTADASQTTCAAAINTGASKTQQSYKQDATAMVWTFSGTDHIICHNIVALAAASGGGNAAPTFPGPNIGNLSGTVGTALTSNNVASKFSDTDALTFSAVGTWPPGVTVSSAGVISGTPTTAGTYASLKVRATDTAAQTVDSDTFSFTISASAHLITVANSQQVNTASSGAIQQSGNGTITLPALKDWGTGNLKANETGVTIIVNNATTGVLVALLTGQTANASGVLPTLTGLVSGTAYRVTTILADGSEGTWKYTAS